MGSKGVEGQESQVECLVCLCSVSRPHNPPFPGEKYVPLVVKVPPKPGRVTLYPGRTESPSDLRDPLV